MKKAKLILIIVLGILLLLYIGLKIANPAQRSSKVFKLNPDKLSYIEIFTQEEEVKLIKEEGTWKTTLPIPWPADSLKIHNFFEDVLKAEYFSTPISSSEYAIKDYELEEEQALHVRVGDGKNEVHVLYSNLGNPWDYFRYADGKVVYQVRSKVVQKYQPSIIQWRSSDIIHYWEEDLRQIKVEYDKNSYTLDRRGTEWFYRDANNDFQVDFNNFSLTKIIGILQNFRSEVFVSGEDEEFRKLFNYVECTVWITDVEGNTRKLEFSPYDSHRYMLRIDDDNTVYYQVLFDTVFRFMRQPEIFKRKG